MTIIINAQGAERKRLVQTISTWLDLPPQYCGAPSFSYKVGCITIDKTGSLVIGEGLSEDAIERLIHGRTTLMIAHRLSTLRKANKIIVVDKGETKDGVPQSFLLSGAGWGHGVGLCQIGAAVMGEKGYTYEEILLHYYKGADIRKFY